LELSDLRPVFRSVLVDEDLEVHLLSFVELRSACLMIAADNPLLYGSPWWWGRVIGRLPSLTIFTACFPPTDRVHPSFVRRRIALRWSSSFAIRPDRTLVGGSRGRLMLN
jgi:hypothetical protein